MEETTMKKKLALLLTAVLAVSMLGGCGGSSSSGKAEEPAAENTEETEAPAEEAPAEEAVTYQFIDETLGVESYAIGFRIGDEELAQTVSGAVQALVLNGTYEAIGEKYPDIKDYLCLKAEDIDEASLPAQGSGDSSYTFKHGFDLDYPPYSYRQDDGTVGCKLLLRGDKVHYV